MSGALSLVLHTHMPYVEGFGTWPFGEEWLWEAVATSYVPLVDVLDEAPGRVTLSVTPVLADQLEAPGALERCEAFLREVRPESHRLDLAAAGEEGPALEHSARRYAQAAEGVAGVAGGLLRHASWTSAATHPVLPLLATDAGILRQVATGIAAHRARTDRPWDGGFWLPECAHAPWLDPLLAGAGVRAVCVELTDVLGEGAPGHLHPLRSATAPGLTLVPIDRAVVDLVWGGAGYPAHPAYRDTHRLTERRHQAWANDGAVYDPARAAAQVERDAADFVARVRERLRTGGLCVCALDTELLGHWWHEGVAWLAAVLAQADAAGFAVLPLDGALADVEPVPAPAGLPVTTWGTPRDLSTWSGPGARGLAWRQRAAELRVAREAAPSERAVRELLALQASDWAFQLTRALAGDYPLERIAGHEAELVAALDGPRPPALRNLAPYLG